MPKYKVFISYRKVISNEAEEIKEFLSRFYPDRVYLDTSEIYAGYVWKELKEALRSSEYLLLLISKTSFACHFKKPNRDFYLKEIQTALEIGLPIIPVMFTQIPTLHSGDAYAEAADTLSENPLSGIDIDKIGRDNLCSAIYQKLQKYDELREKQRREALLRTPLSSSRKGVGYLKKNLFRHPIISLLGFLFLFCATSCLVFPEARDYLHESISYGKEKFTVFQQELRQAYARQREKQGPDKPSENVLSAATEGSASTADHSQSTEQTKKQAFSAKQNQAAVTFPSATDSEQKRTGTVAPKTSQIEAKPLQTVNGAKKLHTVNGKASRKTVNGKAAQPIQPQQPRQTTSFSDLLGDPFMPH